MSATQDKTYNGYSNYETWSIALFIDNEQASQQRVLDMAAQCVAGAPSAQQVQEDIWTVEQAARFELADMLLDHAQELTDLENLNLMAQQLLSAALEEVNWNELASLYIDQLAELDES